MRSSCELHKPLLLRAAVMHFFECLASRCLVNPFLN